jgi:hypothetical protein
MESEGMGDRALSSAKPQLRNLEESKRNDFFIEGVRLLTVRFGEMIEFIES